MSKEVKIQFTAAGGDRVAAEANKATAAIKTTTQARIAAAQSEEAALRRRLETANRTIAAQRTVTEQIATGLGATGVPIAQQFAGQMQQAGQDTQSAADAVLRFTGVTAASAFAIYQLGKNSRDAWTANTEGAKAAFQAFDGANIGASSAQMIQNIDALGVKFGELKKKREEALTLTGFTGVMNILGGGADALFGGKSFAEKKFESDTIERQAAQRALQAGNEAIALGEKENEIILLRIEGRKEEADLLSRSLEMEKEIARINATSLQDFQKKQLIQQAVDRNQAANVAQVRAEQAARGMDKIKGFNDEVDARKARMNETPAQANARIAGAALGRSQERAARQRLLNEERNRRENDASLPRSQRRMSAEEEQAFMQRINRGRNAADPAFAKNDPAGVAAGLPDIRSKVQREKDAAADAERFAARQAGNERLRAPEDARDRQEQFRAAFNPPDMRGIGRAPAAAPVTTGVQQAGADISAAMQEILAAMQAMANTFRSGAAKASSIATSVDN